MPGVDFPLQGENASATIKFDFLPNGLFGRLIVLAFEYYFSESTLYHNDGDYRDNNNETSNGITNDKEEIEIKNKEERTWSDAINSFCNNLEGSEVQGEGRLVNKTWMAFTIEKNKRMFAMSIKKKAKEISIYLLKSDLSLHDNITNRICQFFNTLNRDFYNNKMKISIGLNDQQVMGIGDFINKGSPQEKESLHWRRPNVKYFWENSATAPAFLRIEAEQQGYYTIPK